MAEVKSVISINVVKKENTFMFLLPARTSYQDCYDAFVEGAEKIKEMAEKATAIEKEEKEKKDKENGTKE